MDKSTCIRVKLKFRDKIKIARLDSKADKSLSSIANLRRLVFNNFPEIEDMVNVQEASSWRKVPATPAVLELKYQVSMGDFLTLENDQDLNVAMVFGNGNLILVQIDVKTSPKGTSSLAPSSTFFRGRTAAVGYRDNSEGSSSRISDHSRGKEAQCRYFQRGLCKSGPTCRFSHDSEASLASNLSRTVNIRSKAPVVDSTQQATMGFNTHNTLVFRREVDYWLRNQIESLSATENIEQLSQEKGLQLLSSVVEQRNLHKETITQFVKLLVKEDIRSSLLRNKTNKIYGVLLGSPFLLQLHAHIAALFGAKTQDVRPYVLLIEELQSRTKDGWKEVPLDALHSVVSKLGDDPGKDELLAIVSRLIDQREKLQRTLAVAPPDKCLRGAGFREVPIVASKDELLRVQGRQDLPVNRIGMQYSSLRDYLETHFQLLREDCIDPLRQGIRTYRLNDKNGRNKASSSLHQELRIYSEVRLLAVRCGDNGIEYVLSFHVRGTNLNEATHWEVSKRLMFGALLCISSDKFETFFWGTVARRDIKELAKGRVAIRIIGESDANVTASLQSGQTSGKEYVMVESATAYFEAYYHVLKSLQREEMEEIPFTRYLLHLDPKVSAPSYLLRRKRGDLYDFTSAFPKIREKFGRSSVRILQSEWPGNWADFLDKAQLDALKHGLTKELAIIQGPPGTGKTFIGLLLVKILLHNLKQSSGHDLKGRNPRGIDAQVGLLENREEEFDMSGPILIICYTNHALDQFLEGIYEKTETNLIRIGGRGKSEILKTRNLQFLLQQQRTENEVDGSHRRFFWQGRSRKDDIEKEIHECIDVMSSKLVTSLLLEGVATWEQIESLFSVSRLNDKSSSEIVDVWLHEEWCRDPHLAYHFFTTPKAVNIIYDESLQTSQDKPLRGAMKLLPQTDADEEWTEVRRRPRRQGRRGASPMGRDEIRIQVPWQLLEEDLEGAQGWIDLVDEGGERINMIDNYDHLRNGRHDPPQAGAGDEDLNAAEVDDMDLQVDPGIVLPVEDEVPLQDYVDAPNVWLLNLAQRRKLHSYWLDEIRVKCQRQLKELSKQYEEACRAVIEVENEIQLSLLRKAKVVGMTTTAAAKHHDILKSLKAEIVIIEEAAEVLESHILACLSSSIKHLILIGDHMQLRPSVAVYRLATENKLDVSMFERLVRSGVEHVTLQEQRRMRPNISRLVRRIYPNLKDHKSVHMYKNIEGVNSNVFFFDHKAGEDQTRDIASKVNVTEAKLVVELCLYLLNQSYSVDDISILTMYTGQLQEIKTHLREKIQKRFWVRPIGQSRARDPEGNPAEDDSTDLLPRVSSVDDYQGEESDIIILSLVRSNEIVTNEGVGKIGFLSISNRICVALTRARKGLFIFGNAELLGAKSSLWKQATNDLREDGTLGPYLELYCQNHPDERTKISKVEDFKQVEDGGCSRGCEFQLDCGHVCPRRCHPRSHDLVVCPKPCLKLYDECHHQCQLRCHGTEDCLPCEVIVEKQLEICNHTQAMICSRDVKQEVCRSVCPKILQCGHNCRKLCGRPCTAFCKEIVEKTLPCGHAAKISCHEDPATHRCDQPCEVLLPDCQHPCGGTCGKCKQGTEHVPCQKKCGRILPCGHGCDAGCSVVCPPCRKKCPKRCVHSRCASETNGFRACGEMCKPCREKCSWKCKHHECEKLCHEICTRPRCDLPCPKLIRKCKHECIGLCGEVCPTKCRICHPQTRDIITLMILEEYEESDRFIQLEDCGHIFEVSGLDTWMDASDADKQSEETVSAQSVAIKLKECPECRTPIWRTHRYSRIVKETLAQLEKVKVRMFGYEQTKQGSILLEQGEYVLALSAFRKAMEMNPGLMEAHLGTGCAFFKERDYGKAMIHLSFIVERSSFASELQSVIERGRGRDGAGFLERVYGSASSTARDPIATQAILQWASALTAKREFGDAIKLCDVIHRRDPMNRMAAELKEKANKGEVQLVVQVLSREVGLRGHWYTCPNGHLYTIGECGGANQVSKCPDCKAVVGGKMHQLAVGNRHSNIDGSSNPAWPS